MGGMTKVGDGGLLLRCTRDLGSVVKNGRVADCAASKMESSSE